MASTSSANRKAFAFANLIVDTLIFDAIGEQVGEDIFHVDELATANGSSGTFETFTDTATLSIDVIVLTGPVTSVGIFVDTRGRRSAGAFFCDAVLFTRHRVNRHLLA